MLFLGINTPETMDLPPLVPLTPPLPTLPKSKWEVRIFHRDASLLGISLIGKKHGGVMVRSAPNRQIRRGMSLISVNKVDVQTATLSEVVRLLKTRPLDLLFRPAPTGSSISGEPDPHAPPPRPSPNERRDCAAYVHREKRKQELKKKHFAMIQRYRIGPPKNQNNLAEIHMCNYRNTFQERSMVLFLLMYATVAVRIVPLGCSHRTTVPMVRLSVSLVLLDIFLGKLINVISFSYFFLVIEWFGFD